jgi:serine/threonine-protein phosphatase 5
VKIVPKDPDAMKKLRECEKAVQKLRFEEAIATSVDNHSIVDSVDYESMCKYSSVYSGERALLSQLHHIVTIVF